MARRSRSRGQDSAPGWVWMMFGLGLGLIVAVGVYLREPTRAPNSGAVTRAPTAARPAPVATTREAAESRFEFYEILPQLEVAVPDAGAPAPRAAPRPRSVESPGSFLLQVGSFSAASDADRLQANLALLGFESHIQRVVID